MQSRSSLKYTSVQAITGVSGVHLSADEYGDDAAASGRPACPFAQPLTATATSEATATLYALAKAAVAQWGDERVVRSWQPREGAGLTHAVLLLLHALGGAGVEASGALLSSVLNVRIAYLSVMQLEV